MYQLPSIGEPIVSKLDASLFNITTAIAAGNFDQVDHSHASDELYPQILDTTLAPFTRTVNIKMTALKSLASAHMVSFGVPCDGTAPDEERPWRISYSVTASLYHSKPLIFRAFIGRMQSGSLSITRTSPVNQVDEVNWLPEQSFNVYANVGEYLSQIHCKGQVLVGAFDETLLDGTMPFFDPDTDPTHPLIIGVAINNIQGAATNVSIYQGTISFLKDPGGVDMWEGNR